MAVASNAAATLRRKHFETSRLLDFFSQKELIAQTGHQVTEWPLVLIKELFDNALDACEEAGIAPEISVEVTPEGIRISDNGPGIPQSVIESVLDFSVRVSSREAYVSPSRGAQGNALKTIVAMPFVLMGSGGVEIESQGIRHRIQIDVDRLRQQPRIEHQQDSGSISGTSIFIDWPNDAEASFTPEQHRRFLQNDLPPNEKASFILSYGKERFLQFADDYGWLNPHLTLNFCWGDVELEALSTRQDWSKWKPSDPTDPHWYTVEDLSRLIAATACHAEQNNQPSPTVREFVSEFRGLSGSAKQKATCEEAGLLRSRLADLIVDGEISEADAERLLSAMKQNARPVKAKQLGVIGEEHLKACCLAAGGSESTFEYRKVLHDADGERPLVVETCFAYCPSELQSRRIVTGVNWSPAIKNPFRQLGAVGQSLDSLLASRYADRSEPIVFALHVSCPKVSYSDRGKSAVVFEE
jgi:DNA topoisomerase VI subunit B